MSYRADNAGSTGPYVCRGEYDVGSMHVRRHNHRKSLR